MVGHILVCFTLLTSRKTCTPWTHRLNEPSRWGIGTTAGAAHLPPSFHLSPLTLKVYSLSRLQEQSLKYRLDHVASLLIAFGIKSKLLAMPLGTGMIDPPVTSHHTSHLGLLLVPQMLQTHPLIGA